MLYNSNQYMSQLIFVTGNDLKFKGAQHLCAQHGITLTQQDVETVEIQAESGEPIARHKANEAFQKLQEPVIVTDDTWVIPALRGFPGPYMKSVNHWFTAEDWLRLTLPLEDREIILRQVAVYQDEREQVLFSVDVKGILLKEIRGNHAYPHMMITSFDGGNRSDAEAIAEGHSDTVGMHTVWQELSKWLQERQS